MADQPAVSAPVGTTCPDCGEHWPDVVFDVTEHQVRWCKGRPQNAPTICDGFAWMGQPLSSCDDCGQPAWHHQGQKRSGIGPFHPYRIEVWPHALIGKWLTDGVIDADRAKELLSVEAV